MKKAIALLLVLVMAFFACSCGGKNNGELTEEEKYVFKSSEKQKVYKSGSNYMIFYYEGETITGIDTVMTFPSEEVATSSLEVLKKNENKKVAEIVQEGKFIVMHMTDEYISDYLKMTADGVESYLKGQGYVLVEKIEDEATTAASKETEKKTEKATTKAPEKTTAKATEKAAEKTTTAAKK